MLTLKKVKELVEAPSHAKRTPSPKMLFEEGIVLLRREFDQGSHLTVYNSGYVLFSAGKRNTVFHIHDCCGDYAYDAAEGKGDVIKEEYFENCEWHIRALFEGERKMEDNQAKCEGAGRSNVCVSYHALSEDWSEIADRTINMLEKIIENGNLVTRDLLYDAATNKQFITVETSGGNTFYIVIDYDKPVDEDGEQYHTYFLNMVDEADLLAALEAAGGELPACSCTEKCAPGAIHTDCEVCAVNMTECAGTAPEPAPVTEPAEEPEPEPQQKSNTGTLLLILAVAVLGGGAGWYFKIYRPKHEKAAVPEEDYSEELADYDDPEDDGPPWDEDDTESEDNE